MPIAPATSLSFAAELDRRSGARRPLRVAATAVMAAGQQLPARTLDVGLRSLSIIVAQSLPASTECEVMLNLPLKGASHPLRLRARVTYGVLASNGFRIDLSLHDTTAEDDMALEKYVMQ